MNVTKNLTRALEHRYVLDTVGFIERAFLLPVKIDNDGFISGYDKMLNVLKARAKTDPAKSAAVKLSEEVKLDLDKKKMKLIRDWFNKINIDQPDPDASSSPDDEGQLNPNAIVDMYVSSDHYQNNDDAIVDQERYKPKNFKAKFQKLNWERVKNTKKVISATLKERNRAVRSFKAGV